MLKHEASRYIIELSTHAKDPAAYRRREIEELRPGEGVRQPALFRQYPELASYPPPLYVWKPGDLIYAREAEQVVAELEEFDSLPSLRGHIGPLSGLCRRRTRRHRSVLELSRILGSHPRERRGQVDRSRRGLCMLPLARDPGGRAGR